MRAEAASHTVADAVADPELRQLITRIPPWRRPGLPVRRLSQIHHALFFKECAGFDISPVPCGILTTLSLPPGADQKSIAPDVGVDRTSVADVLSGLARRRLVRRQRGVAGKRSFVTWLTPEVERLIRAMPDSRRRARERFLVPLDGPGAVLFAVPATAARVCAAIRTAR